MNNISVLILYIITIFIIGLLLYLAVNKPRKIQVINELPAPQRFETHWWGYGWRPWWRKYQGVPGLAKPEMPVKIQTS